MDKIKIAFLFKAFPFTMAHYYLRALKRRTDVELCVIGEYYGQYIPWNGGMEIPMRYPNEVDVPLPRGMDRVPWTFIEGQIPWTPDLVLNVDAGFHLSTKPPVPYAVVATDPHVLGDWYAKVRPITDYFFNMQPSYLQGTDRLLPYAFDPFCHYPTTNHYSNQNVVETEYDCSIIGLHYPQRDEWVKRLQALGIKVNYRIGDIYDEYRHENNKAWIGLNWSSLQDVTARVFEICAMKLVPVFNRLPGLDYLGFEEGKHYLGFSTMDEAVAQVVWAKNNRAKAEQIAQNAYDFVHERQMTWDNRVDKLLHETKLV